MQTNRDRTPDVFQHALVAHRVTEDHVPAVHSPEPNLGGYAEEPIHSTAWEVQSLGVREVRESRTLVNMRNQPHRDNGEAVDDHFPASALPTQNSDAIGNSHECRKRRMDGRSLAKCITERASTTPPTGRRGFAYAFDTDGRSLPTEHRQFAKTTALPEPCPGQGDTPQTTT